MLRAFTGRLATYRNFAYTLRPPGAATTTLRTRLLATMGAQATHTVNTTRRLEALRQLMSTPENDVTAYVVPSEDQRAWVGWELWVWI